MNWTAPAFDEIKMDAEIGSYQEDFDPAFNSERPQFCNDEAPPTVE